MLLMSLCTTGMTTVGRLKLTKLTSEERKRDFEAANSLAGFVGDGLRHIEKLFAIPP